MPKRFRALLATVVFASAGFAHAQVVTYTFSGTGTGTVNGTAFTAQTYTFTVSAPAATVQNAAYPYSNVLSGGEISVAGSACSGGCTISNPSDYLVFNAGPTDANVHGISLVGEIDVDGSTLIEGCWLGKLCGGTNVNDNLVSAVAPTASGEDGAEAPYFAFATSGGVVQITALEGEITYSVAAAAQGASVSPVPTLSFWGLVLLAALVALGVAGARSLPPRQT